MVKLIRQGVYLAEGRLVKEAQAFMTSDKKSVAEKNTVTYKLMKAHGGKGDEPKLSADGYFSEGDGCVDIVRTARACGVEKFPLPVLFGGRKDASSREVNDFLLSAAKKYGGTYVPPHISSVREFLLDRVAKCGQVYVTSDPSLRLGAVGVLSFSVDGYALAELVTGRAASVSSPEVVAVYLKGKLRRGVGARDIALSIVKATANGFLKGCVLEFVGPAVPHLSMDLRGSLDGMLAATGCASTVWETDARTQEFLKARGREKDFKELHPVQPAFYSKGMTVDLSRVEPMLALSEEPADIRTLSEFPKEEQPAVSKGAISDGTFETLAECAEIARGGVNAELTVCPRSLPVLGALADGGYLSALSDAGVGIGSPVPHGNVLCDDESMLKEGAFLMDARSIAASAKEGKIVSAMGGGALRLKKPRLSFGAYEHVKTFAAEPEGELAVSENISSDFPAQAGLPDDVLIQIVSKCSDAALKSADLLPAECGTADLEKFASQLLMKKDTGCVFRAWKVRSQEEARKASGLPEEVLNALGGFVPSEGAVLGSAVLSKKTEGEGRAALALKVLGGVATVCTEYLGDFRSALVRQGILPFLCEKPDFAVGDYLYIEGIKDAVARGDERVVAHHFSKGKQRDVALTLGTFSPEERQLLLAGGYLNRLRRAR